MLIVAIEFIGDKLPRIDDVYQPIMTRAILPNVTNANQTDCQSTDCLFERSMTCFMVCSRGMVYRIGQFRCTVLSGQCDGVQDEDSLVALPCLMRFPTRTRWYNATAAENYVLIQAKVQNLPSHLRGPDLRESEGLDVKPEGERSVLFHPALANCGAN
jgi:hypothetical protein